MLFICKMEKLQLLDQMLTNFILNIWSIWKIKTISIITRFFKWVFFFFCSFQWGLSCDFPAWKIMLWAHCGCYLFDYWGLLNPNNEIHVILKVTYIWKKKIILIVSQHMRVFLKIMSTSLLLRFIEYFAKVL